MNKRRRQPGFTLIELVLVLLLIAAALALVAPALRGWGRGAALRRAADDLVARAAWARSQAAAEAVEHRLVVAADGASYRVMVDTDGTLQPAPGERGQPIMLPPRLSLQLSGGASELRFHPTGRVSAVTVRLTADWGDAVELTCAGPAEPLRVASVDR